jgi:beta-lactamase class A
VSRDDTDQLIRRWHESDCRSRERRAARRARRSKVRPLICLAAVLAAAAWVGGERLAPPADDRIARAAPAHPPLAVKGVSAHSSPAFPSAAAMRSAWRFARQRGGRVSIAVVDTRRRLRGRATLDTYPSASVVKAMLLVAEARRLRRHRLELDGPTLDRLRAMITQSDNDSADAIYARVGDAGLREVATAAGLRRFRVAMSWGYAQVTAADMARLFARLSGLTPPRYRHTVLKLLRSLTPEHRWGIIRAAGRRWAVHAKGGWRETASGHLVHQAAWLHHGRRDLSIAVLTDAQPSHVYGVHTVRGIADRLLRAR